MGDNEKDFKQTGQEFKLLQGMMDNLYKKMEDVTGLFPKSPVKPVEINGIKCNAHIGAAGCIVLTFPNGGDTDVKQLFDSLTEK